MSVPGRDEVIRKLFLCVTLAAAGCMLAGCPGGSGGGSSSVLVGYYGDLTGNTATFGVSTREGIELAMGEINQSPPLGKPLELRVEDDQGKPEQANSVVTKLITQDGVVAVLGEVASSNSRAAAPICQREQVPMITPASTNVEVTRVGDFIFRICFIDPFQGSVMAKFARESKKAQKAAILTDVKSDYSTGLSDSFRKTFEELGGKVVAQQNYSGGDTNFNAQLSSIKQQNPDVLFIPGYYNEVGTIARQARDLGIKAILMGGDGWDSPKLFESGGKAIVGGYFSNHYSAESQDPKVQEFIKAYQAKFNGKVPDAMAALGYDSAKILADAMKRANSTEGPALRDAIAQTKDFPGVTGAITLDSERNATKPAVVLEVQDGKYRYVETVTP
jgi:branched-chain amino acid transport system substrate-binding protein